MFIRFRSLALITVLLGILSCAQSEKATKPLTEPVLTEAEAKQRFDAVGDIHYDLFLNLSDTDPLFSGEVQILFDLKNIPNSLRVDFFDGEVLKIVKGDVPIAINYNSHYISIPKSELKKGKNQFTISFRHKYANNGRGLHRFTDPEDQRAYLYTQFESFNANRMFPCFDQPDLKATFTLKTETPKEWTVVTSTRETDVKKIEGNRSLWTFPKSTKFSTYLFSVHAGPYRIWMDNYKIPLRLFARRSQAKYVQPKDWFSYTRSGFEFFNAYFDYPYPYLKYDQLIVPEFNAGAMENVAAVTFTENFIARGEYSEAHLRRMANVILHEMAHMWFGNLVTMKWWNDLWLKESFATYMASLGSSQIKEFSNDAWLAFFDSKTWGYWEDQMVTTHPILATIHSTAETSSHFDGITYSKGAAVVKQLHYFVGDQSFKNGLRAYFKKHAESTTTLNDFINALSASSKLDLNLWSKSWLETANLNTVQAEWTCKDNRLSSLTLKQGAPQSHPTIRPHRLSVALIQSQKGRLKISESKDLLLESESAQLQTEGLSCPFAVFPNYEDRAYIKVELDQKSLSAFKTHLHKLDDSLTRKMAWYSLYEMVRDGELDIYSLSEQIIAHGLSEEKHPLVVHEILRSIITPWGGGLIYYLSRDQFKDDAKAKALIEKFQDLIYAQLKVAKPGSELQKQYYASYVAAARTPKHLNRLAQILSGKLKFRGLKVDPDKRWELVSRLAIYNHPPAAALIESELKRDSSFRAQLIASSAKASLKSYEDKLTVIDAFLPKDSSKSLHEVSSEFRGLFPDPQRDLRAKYSTRFYKDLLKVSATKDESFARSLLTLSPELCEEKALTDSKHFLNSNKKTLPDVVVKNLMKSQEEGRRCINITNVAKQKL